MIPKCPQCGELATLCISGEELDIAYMENAETCLSVELRLR
jgi:hypothetical protein